MHPGSVGNVDISTGNSYLHSTSYSTLLTVLNGNSRLSILVVYDVLKKAYHQPPYTCADMLKKIVRRPHTIPFRS